MKQHPHPKTDAISLVEVLSCLGDPVRLSIVAALHRDGERGSSEFDCSVGGSTLSHHIRQLREAGLIVHRKEGTRCFVALRPELETLFPGLIGQVLEHYEDAPAD